jgi:hypothetical protein
MDAEDVLFIMTLCELLGKPARLRDVERAYAKVVKQVERERDEHAQNPEDRE